MYNSGRPAVAPTGPGYSAPPRTQSAPPTSQPAPLSGQPRGPGGPPPMRNVDAPHTYQPYAPPLYGQPGYPYAQPDPATMPPYAYPQAVPPHPHFHQHYHNMYPGYALPPAAAPPYASPPQQGPQTSSSGKGGPSPTTPQQTKASKAIPIVDPTAPTKAGQPVQPQLAPHHLHQHQHLHHYPPHLTPHIQPHPQAIPPQAHMHLHPHPHPLPPYAPHAAHPPSLPPHPGLQHPRPGLEDENLYPKGAQSSWTDVSSKSSAGLEYDGGMDESVTMESVGSSGMDSAYEMMSEHQARGHQMMRNMHGKGSPDESMELYPGAPGGAKKMYSVEFLLRFQHDQTEPPEKIKLFSEIYMPTGVNDNGVPLPQQRGQRTGALRAKRGAAPPQGNDRGDYSSGRGKLLPPPGALADLSGRVSDPFRAYSPKEDSLMIVKKVNGILNKITPEKYDILMQSMLELHFDVSNHALLDQIIACVFERAVQHQLFCHLFADVCRDLTQKFAQTHTKKEGEEAKSTAHASFRRALLNKCQTEFETPPPPPDGATPEQREEHDKKMRARQLGNIKFIGELFKRKMLTEKIMHEVIKRLLLGNPPQEAHQPSDEEIEVLCRLLKTVGQQLDRQEAAPYMDHYFEKIRTLQQNHPRKRIRFLLQDTIELRNDNWVPRREEQKAQTFAEMEQQRARKDRERHDAMLLTSKGSSPHGKGVKGGVAAPPPVPVVRKGGKGEDPAGRPAPRGPASPYQQPLVAVAAGRGVPPGAEPMGGTPAAWPTPVLPAEDRSRSVPVAPPAPAAAVAPGKGGKRRASLQRDPSDRPPSEDAVSDATLEQTAIAMIEEFRSCPPDGDLAGLVVENFKQVGERYHKHLLAKAIQHATSSVAKHANTREVLAEIIVHLTCEPEKDSKASDYAVSMETVFAGFCHFFEDAIDLGRLEDNPRLWDCFAHLAVCCLQAEALTFSDLNFCLPDAFVEGEEVFPCFLALFSRLKIEPNCIDLVCTGHFDTLQKLFCTDKTASRIARFLQLLETNSLLEVDPSVYIYYAFQTQQEPDELLQWLQKTIPEGVTSSEVVTLKVAAPTILYSCVATNVFVNPQHNPRLLFQRFLDLFSNQLIKPILKYSQNERPELKLLNELQCLLEARRFCCITNFQPGLLCNFFQVFYELEIVTEDAYYLWRKRDSRWGTDLALKEVQSFLSFLENGDAEPAEEDGPAPPAP